MIEVANKYTEMQQAQYDAEARVWSLENRDPVVGSFDAHNNWSDYDDFLFFDVEKPLSDCLLLDFGCGPGRNIVKYNKRFTRVDGVDISQINLDNAKKWIAFNGSIEGNLYKNNGVDLSVITSDTYDVVMSTICFQHICVHEIRKNYIKEFYRVLNVGGVLTMQMGFGGKPDGYLTAEYEDNAYDALYTNSGCDTVVRTPDQLEADLLASGFVDFHYYIRPTGPGDTHRNWIFFNARKPILANRE